MSNAKSVLKNAGNEELKVLSESLEPGCIKLTQFKMGVPQLKHLPYMTDVRNKNSTGVGVHRDKLITPKGDQFQEISDIGEVRSGSYLDISFMPLGGSIDVGNHLFALEMNKLYTLRLGFEKEHDRMCIALFEEEGMGFERCKLMNHPVPSPCVAMDKLLMPSKWLWEEEVLKFRSEYGDCDDDPFVQFDPNQTDPRNKICPMQLLLLKCVLAHQNIRWAEYLKLLCNGRFKSECINTSRDTNKFVLRHCDPETNLWEEDLGDGHFRALVDRMKRNITHLVEEEWFGWSLEAFVSAEIEGYTMDEFESAVMSAAVKALDPKQESLPLKEIAIDKIEKALRKLCADWHPYYGSKFPKPVVKMLFEWMLMDNSFQFDAKKQINFSDGMCYEPGKQLVRQIEPSDGATLKMPYALPIMDDVKQTELDGYLGEIFPNKRVCDWNIAQRARCLQMSQANPLVLMSFGRAGGGKNTLCDLTIAAYGTDYAVQPDKALFGHGSKFDSPEAPKSMRAQLEHKLYVCAHEPPAADGDTLKDWTGGSKINARGMRKNNKSFPAEFAALELTFNPRSATGLKLVKDDGLERRVKGCKYENGYTYCATEEEAKERAEDLKKEGVYPMTIAKNKAIMALAPQLMARFLKIHQEGIWPDEPPEITEWTSELWAVTVDANPLQEPVCKWYKRCDCMPSQDGVFDNMNLVDAEKKPCTHHIKGSFLMAKLKTVHTDNGDSLYKSVKGRGRDDAPIYAMLAKVKMGDPPIFLLKKEMAHSPVIYGLRSKA